MGDITTIGGNTVIREEAKTAGGISLWSLPQNLHSPITITRMFAPQKKNVIAIIPARGNSKRIPRKNMKLLGGKPLIQYTLDAAQNAKTIETVFVTTEDNEIGDFCFSYGNGKIQVIRRPEYLARDDVQLDEVTLHTYRIIQEKGYSPDALVLLPPTNPFRSSQDVDEAVSLYYSNGSLPHPTIIGVYKDYKFHWSYEYGCLNPEFHNPEKRLGKQWIKEGDWLYAENGAIYVCDAERFGQEKIVRMHPFTPYIMSEERSLDLDTLLDWLIAEQMIERGTA